MRRRGLVANSGLALAGDLASKIGLLGVMVIAARTLSTGELAVLGTALAGAGILAVTLDSGSGLLITRDGARDEAARGSLFRALGVLRLPVAALVILAAAGLGVLLDQPIVSVTAAVLGVLGALASSLIGYFRAGQDMKPEAVQKLVFAGLALAIVAIAVAVSRTAEAVAAGLVCASAVSLVPLALRARRRLHSRSHAGKLAAFRLALPLGLMAIATVVYYRSGTVALAVLSTPDETAAFTVASAVGFGLLMLPNAITTGLLPHLAADRDGLAPDSTRRALRWSLLLSTPIAAGAALAGYLLLGPLFGAAYADAALPLAILCAAVVLIAYNGILGTALLAAGHVRVIALQVAVSLVVNLVALALLAPSFGAAGAATATLLCEIAAVAMLTVASVRHLPGFVPVRGLAAAPQR